MAKKKIEPRFETEQVHQSRHDKIEYECVFDLNDIRYHAKVTFHNFAFSQAKIEGLKGVWSREDVAALKYLEEFVVKCEGYIEETKSNVIIDHNVQNWARTKI